MSLLDDEQTVFGNQAELVLGFQTGAASHELLAGLELSRYADDFTLDVAQLPIITLRDPVETATAPQVIPPLSQAGEARSTVIAPYVLDHVRVGRVNLFVGARLDSIAYEEPVSGTDRDDTRLSPMLGLTWQPVDKLSLYASAGTAFAPPSTLVVGEREPETSRQVEVGLKRELARGRVFASVAGYHLEREDIAIPDSTGVTRQTGDQRSRGIEFELTAEPVAGWFSAVSYALNDSELVRFAEIVSLTPDGSRFAVLDHSGNTPAFAPRHLFNAWTVRRFGRFSLGAGARYVGRQFIAEDNAYAIDDYVTFDAMAGYRHGRFALSVNARNLTDVEYETRGFGNASVIPAEPFTLAATVRVGFGRR
jgi:iron complex outermembrane receptor protein